jgi:hypothetical protein
VPKHSTAQMADRPGYSAIVWTGGSDRLSLCGQGSYGPMSHPWVEDTDGWAGVVRGSLGGMALSGPPCFYVSTADDRVELMRLQKSFMKHRLNHQPPTTSPRTRPAVTN